MNQPKLTPHHLEKVRAEAIRHAGVGIVLLEVSDGTLMIRDANDAFGELVRYDVASLAGKPFSSLFGPRTERQQVASLVNAARSGRPWRDTITLMTAADAPLPVTVVLAPRQDPASDQGTECVIATVLDATDYVRLRNVQRLSSDINLIIGRSADAETQARGLAATMVRDFADWCAIHLRDPEGNLSLVALTSRTDREPTGDSDVDVTQNGIGKTFASGIPLLHQSSHPENPALAKQMQQIIGEPVRAVTSVAIASNALEVFGTITWAITDDARDYHHEDVHAAEEVGAKFGHFLQEHEIRESLARAVRAREGFMKAAGHELRTPLVSIKGYTQLLLRDFRRDSVSPQRLEVGLKAIDTSTSRLTDLMEDLFAVANPGLNALPLRLVTVDISAYVREFLSTTPSLTLTGHSIHLELTDEPLPVRVDLTRFSQVLFNVAINAVHFSPPESDIYISTARNEEWATISVRDSGKGLVAGEETSIFDPFTHARSFYGSEDQGLGIGLYISRQIMTRHNGEIWAESAGQDMGTTFHIRLPLAPDQSSGKEATPPPGR